MSLDLVLSEDVAVAARCSEAFDAIRRRVMHGAWQGAIPAADLGSQMYSNVCT